MGKFIDLSGQKINEITVLEKDIKATKEKSRTYWKCQCSCGIIKSIRADNLKKINVRQGYCKCSCLNVSENAVITDDECIYKALCLNEIDALLISKGDITLNGHDYGFIGGASGKISKTDILFFGDVTKHRDYKKIAGFIEKHGCKIISLDFPLTDFGGIIPITEKAP